MDILQITPQWLAGFFDGEGCIFTCKHGISYNVLVSITNRNVEAMTLIASKYPKFTFLKNTNEKSCFTVQWRGTSARGILEDICPFLVIKQERAKAALAMIALLRNGSGPISEDNMKKREELAKVIKHANITKHENNLIV